MRLRVTAFLIGVGIAACALLDDAQQCSTDVDCIRIAGNGAVCDRAQAICVPRSSSETPPPPPIDGGDDPVDAATDAEAIDPKCLAPSKPTADVNAGLPPGPDGGTKLANSIELGCDKDWVLSGPLIVSSATTLTIAAATTIRAKKGTSAAIVVQPGGRIVAQGQKDAPIVLTVDSPTPAAGDWGGLYVLGRAPRAGMGPYLGNPLLAYGGDKADDDSGSLAFVRIEYAHYGAVFASVGNKTKVDSVQVRRTNDNCITVNGGTFNAKHLVCQNALDEQLEIQEGYTGRIQFVFGQRTAPGTAHNALLVDGPTTFPVIYNATFCGEGQTPETLGYGLLVRNGSKLDANNAVLTGWLGGVDVAGAPGTPLSLRSSLAFGNTRNPARAETGETDNDNGFDELAFFADGGNAVTNPNLLDCYALGTPKPWPQAPLTAGARMPPSDGFFEGTATFIGAFRDANDDWLRGWTRFD